MESTTVSTLGLLSPEAASALEAVCFDDDDLCCMIADLGILSAVVKLCNDPEMVPRGREVRVENAIHQLRLRAIEERERCAAMWEQYLKEEPPF